MSKAETEAFVAIQFWCDDPEGTDDDLRAILSKLARDAEDAAYERATKACSKQVPEWVQKKEGDYWDGYRDAIDDALTDLRSLKSTPGKEG